MSSSLICHQWGAITIITIIIAEHENVITSYLATCLSTQSCWLVLMTPSHKVCWSTGAVTRIYWMLADCCFARLWATQSKTHKAIPVG